MAILLNSELATTGLIYQIIKQKKNELGEDFSWKHINQVIITPKMVVRYSAWLMQSDCGPIILNFDDNKILSVFEKNKSVLNKVAEDMYLININQNNNSLNHEDENFMDNVMKFLVSEFQPKMNYSNKFINFIVNDFDPVKEKVKVKCNNI